MRASNVLYRRFPTETSVPEWATYITGRSPAFKIHNGIGTAKGAITSHGHGIMYRLTAGREGPLKWIPVAVVNGHDQATHPYRKLKPHQLTEEVVLFTISEEEELRDVA